MKNLIVIASFLVLLTGCKMSSTGSKSGTELKNTKWVLETINDKTVTTPENRNEIHIFLETENDNFNGFAGCNRIFGPVTVDGKKIDLSKTASTMMACDLMGLETEFLTALRSADAYEIKGGKLNLLSGGKAVLTFKAGL